MSENSNQDQVDLDPTSWPVLVTGAGGFVGGHIARELAMAGHHVRGLTRRAPRPQDDDPEIEWIQGDLRDSKLLEQAVREVRGVIHAAAWVSLGRDPRGLSQAINVEATQALLDHARRAGVSRFVLTSTLHTIAAGTRDQPADESTAWNLECVDSPYARSKLAAEGIVLRAGMGLDGGPPIETITLCPGMVLGPRDPTPTSTRLIRTLARIPVAFVPGGGIPIVDSQTIATAHRNALVLGHSGERYAVVGPYLSYIDLAKLVRLVSGRPQAIVVVPDLARRPLGVMATLWECLGLASEFSRATVAGGFLRLHVSGRKADQTLRLVHPSARETIASCFKRPKGCEFKSLIRGEAFRSSPD
jgi:nucleoside-diphosphate-sugar epimerase